MKLVIVLASVLSVRGSGLCPHDELDACLRRVDCSACVQSSPDCASFWQQYEQGLRLLPPVSFVSDSTFEYIDVFRHPRATGGVKLMASAVVSLESLAAGTHIIIPVLATVGGSCPPQNYVGRTRKGFDVAVTECSADCLCTAVLPAVNGPDTLVLFFGPAVSSRDIDIRPKSTNMIHRLLTDVKVGEEEIPAPVMPSSPAQYIENRRAVKTVHSMFVLIAFAGNAAFMVFVFWLSKF